ncbi:MAG: fibronectin type III domain-containing protein [Bacteroidia bacterium]
MRLFLTLALFSTLSFSVKAQTNETPSITSLNAIPRGTQVLLSWNPDKKDITGYVVERSKNGSEFEMFSQVEGANQPMEFLETDFTPLAGLSYYRLTAVYKNGETVHSNIVPVKFSANGTASSPVPGNEDAIFPDHGVLIVVRSADGIEFYSKVEVENSEPLRCSDADPVLAQGTYTIIGCSQQELYSKQIVIN